jgi:hypothetical protein
LIIDLTELADSKTALNKWDAIKLVPLITKRASGVKRVTIQAGKRALAQFDKAVLDAVEQASRTSDPVQQWAILESRLSNRQLLELADSGIFDRNSIVVYLDDLASANSISKVGWKAGPNYDPDKAHRFIIDTYNEYLLDGGVPADFAKTLSTRKTETINGQTYLKLGNLNPKTKTLNIYMHANTATMIEELLHYQQAKMLGIWGKEGFGRKRQPLIEEAVENALKNWGFVRVDGLPPIPY